jgi:integrase
MAEAAPWEIAIRVETAHALSRKGCPRGWALTEHRGFARLNITAKAGGGKRRQIQLPIPWHFDHAKKIGEAVCRIYDDYSRGIEPELAAKKITFTSTEKSDDGSTATQRPNLEQQTDWNALIQRYREYKIRSGEIKDSTWTRVHRHHMKLVLEAFATRQPPRSATQLLDRLTLHWADKPGGRTRQIQMQATSALLRWAVAQGQLPAASWEPPTDLSPFVGRSRSAKAVTTPLEVDHILALVRALPDPRWRLAFQLMAAYGLRPEELQHLQLRDGRLWCTYEKVASRGKTKPRALRLLPCDDWAVDWKLAEQFCPDDLPPMRAGFCGNDIRQYLHRRTLWNKLRQEYEAKGEKLVPYSCRHGYAHRAHVICDLPPKVVAAAMGHSVQTHLAAYSRWCGDDVVDDAFAKAEQRLGQGLRVQSSAA